MDGEPDAWPAQLSTCSSLPSIQGPGGRGRQLGHRLRLLGPLHAGTAGPLEQQLHSLAEAALRVRHASEESAPVDIDSVEGVRDFLRRNPSLSWAVPHAKGLWRLLRERRAVSRGHAPTGELPAGRGGSVGSCGCLGGLRRSTSATLVQRLPPMGGGGAAVAAASVVRPARRADLAQEAGARLAGVDSGSAAALSQRLAQLAPGRQGVVAWVIVETCRDCHLHGDSFRHEERVFASRFAQLRDAVRACLPSGLEVELLVPDQEARRSGAGSVAPLPPVRIGAFEVFLCVARPLVPLGAVALPGGFSAVAVASRLGSLRWTEADEVLRRLVRALPTLPLRVTVRTAAGLPVPGVRVAAAPAEEKLRQGPATQAGSEVVFAAETDERGECSVPVPLCVPLSLEVSHSVLMAPQRRELLASDAEPLEPQEFVAETVVQLWQVEQGAELLVFCASPRARLAPEGSARCVPFQGHLQHPSRGRLRPSASGCLRGEPGFLDGVRAVACAGWQKAPFLPGSHAEAVLEEPEGGMVPAARLPAATVEAQLAAGCCLAPLPGASVSIDGEPVGTTGDRGEAVSAPVRVAAHTIQVEHALARPGLAVPCVVPKPRLCRVQIKLSPERLRLFCTAAAGESGFADLWLVAGDSREWRRSSLRGPPKGSVVWPWNGELGVGPSGQLAVKDGMLCSPVPVADVGAGGCWLAAALAAPSALAGERSVVARLKDGPGGCPLTLLAQQPHLGTPGLWLARLAPTATGGGGVRKRTSWADEQTTVADRGDRGLRLAFRSQCCRRLVFHDASAEVETGGGGSLQSRPECGALELPWPVGEEPFGVRIAGVPRCLLPGCTHHYALSGAAAPRGGVELDAPCPLWLYWIPPRDEGAELEVGEGEENCIFVAVNEEDVPAVARPLHGVLECPGSDCPETPLDGRSLGPFPLRAPVGSWHDAAESPCLLQRLALNLNPPAGLIHFPLEPSPLQEPGDQADCQLQRLSRGPIKMGAFCPTPPPAPLRLELASSCCGRRVCGAQVDVDGQAASALDLDVGIYRVPQPRRKRQQGSGEMRLRIGGVPRCLLPGGSSALFAPFGPFEPETLRMPVSCSIFVYWVPLADSDDPHREAVVVEDGTPEPDMPSRPVVITADADGIPADAQPVQGALRALECAAVAGASAGDSRRSSAPRRSTVSSSRAAVDPGALECPSVVLDGRSLGPFGPPCPGAAGTPDSEDPDAVRCPLADATLQLSPPPGFRLAACDTEDPFGRSEGGCGLLRLAADGAAEAGRFEMVPAPLLTVKLRTGCCGCSFRGVSAIVNGGVRASLGNEGCLRVRRARQGGNLGLVLEGIPPALLHGGQAQLDIPYGATEPEVVEMGVLSHLWLYWVPPDDFGKPEGDLEDPQPGEGLVFVTANPDHIPEGARPVAGTLDSRGGGGRKIVLNGKSMGPFKIPTMASSGLPLPPGLHPDLLGQLSQRQVEAEEGPCSLSRVRLRFKPPTGYEYQGLAPSPLEERVRDLGGCELDRLAKCPAAIGVLRPLAPPFPLRIAVRSRCCARGLAAAQVAVDGFPVALPDASGCHLVPHQRRKRRVRNGHLAVHISGAPLNLLETDAAARPDGVFHVPYGPAQPEVLEVGLVCRLWIYWVEFRDCDSDSEGDPPSEPHGSVFVAVKKEHVPEEARAVQGVLECPGAAVHRLVLNGKALGPYPVEPRTSALPGRPENALGAEAPPCLLSQLSVRVSAPELFSCHPLEPSPLASRCEELGGCELQRLLEAPVAVARLRPTAVPRLPISLRTVCCGAAWEGAALSVNGRCAVPAAEGPLQLRRRRHGGTARVRVQGVPAHMMPDGNLETVASYTAHAPSAVVLQTACPVWVYWLAPDSEPEGAEFDLECEPEGGLVFVAASPDQVPEDAQPVRGHLSCPGAEEHGRELLGDSVGPYYLHHSAVSAQDGDASSPGCLLARLSIQMKDGQAPPMFRYEERDPPPLAERCRELSGCELQRLAGCPVVVGDLRPTALPPLELRMATSCCGCGFPGAKLTINGRDTADFEQEGHVKLRRRRHGGHLEVQVEGVPAQLLAEVPSLLPYKALGPQVMRLDLVCPLWVYWVPPEAGSADEVDLDADGMIFLASDSSQVPEEALPVRGSLGCRGVEEIELDGTSVGPFLVRRAPLPVSTFSSTLAEMRSISKNNLGFGLEGAGGDAIDATPQATPRATPRGTGRMSLARGPASPGGPGGSTSSRSPRRIQRTSTAAFALTRFRREAASKEANEDHQLSSLCLVAKLEIHARAPEGFSFHRKSPSPLRERCLELGGCELQRLLACPLAVAAFKPLPPPPPLSLSLVAGCCGRGFRGACVSVGGRVAEEDRDRAGTHRFPRQRKTYSDSELEIQVTGGLPDWLLPGRKTAWAVPIGDSEPDEVEVVLGCPLWVYWVPTPREASRGEEAAGIDGEATPAGGPLFVVADESQIPEGALPVAGELLCPTVEEDAAVRLDGASLGPYMLRVAGVGTAQSDDCSLARVEVRVDPPELFEYLPRTPSPLMERCAELGGCELQRLVASPLAIGDVRPMEIPPLCVSLRTRCCGQGFEGAVCSMGGMAPAAFGADGRAEFQRNRRGGEGQVTVTGVPPQFLGQQPFVKYGPLEPSGDVRVEALCPLWVYWVLPEDSEEADAAESADREELAAAAGSVFLAADGQHVPDEAEPFCGVLRCPGARVPELELDGTSAGPHFVAAASDFGDGPGSSCLLASLCVEVRPPEGWEYASRDPPPLAERCGELGGCELQRLASCPVAVGDLKPVPLKPLLLSLRTPCCGRGWAGARCSAAGREPVDFGEAGRVRLPRRRRGGEARATVQGVPAHLLPGGSGEVAFSYTAFEPEGLDLEVLCPIWIYYQPPEEEEGDEGDEPLPSKALVFAAADGEHVPDDALPVSGAVECPGAQAEIVLDGTSMGPFLVRRLPRKPEQRDEEQDCLLGGLRFRICGPPGHTFEPKDPSPLQERCGELGGCELQRLVQCPVVVGFLSPSTTGACAQTSSAAESDDP